MDTVQSLFGKLAVVLYMIDVFKHIPDFQQENERFSENSHSENKCYNGIYK